MVSEGLMFSREVCLFQFLTLSFKAACKLFAVASVSTQPIAVNRELGDGEPQVMDVDVQWEFHFIHLNALTGMQINSNNKTKTAENSRIGILVFLLLELTSIFTCSLYLLFFFSPRDCGGDRRACRREK